MKTVIDNTNSTAGWTHSGGAGFISLNSITNYIAGNNDNSIVFGFTGINQYVEKTYDIDIANYDYLIFHIYSVNNRKQDYRKGSDFAYKISISGVEYYLSCYNTFTHVTFDVRDIDILTGIRITALTDNSDKIVISYIVASRDDLPLDIFEGIKEQIGHTISNEYEDKYLIGTFSGSQNDNYIECPGRVSYSNSSLSIAIDDGVNRELHLIKHIDELETTTKLYFHSYFDGDKLLHDYTDALVYINIPVLYANNEQPIVLPSITIDDLTHEYIKLENPVERRIEEFKCDNTFREEESKRHVKHTILIDCEARQLGVLDFISGIARKFLSRRLIWVNGIKCFIDWDDVSSKIEPAEDVKLIPKIQYTVMVTVKEDVHMPTSLPSVQDTNIDTEVINND